MNRRRDWLLVIAYALLVTIVSFGAFWIDGQFGDAHDDQCTIAEVQANLAALNLAIVGELEVADPDERMTRIRLLNEAIRGLNETCDADIPEIST